MSILFLITKSEAGGAQTHVAQLARFLVAHGDHVGVMSAPGGWLEEEMHRLSVEFFLNPELGNTANPLRLLRASQKLSQAVDRFHPDMVACHSTMAGLVGRLTIRNRIPTVFTAHGWGFTQGAPRLRRTLLPMLERLAARFCQRVIVVSKNDLELARRHRIAPAEKLVLIHNGIEGVEGLAPRVPHDPLHLFFVGRLAPPKDPFLLVEAIAGLPTKFRDRLLLTIVGDGPQMPALRELVRDYQLDGRVEFAGTLSRDVLLHRLDTQADAFILFSHWEGFPYSILEAMTRGIPVIASDVGGIREALEGDAGILLPRNDVASAQAALRFLVEHPQEREVMGRRGQERVRQHFSVEEMCARTRKVYDATRRH